MHRNPGGGGGGGGGVLHYMKVPTYAPFFRSQGNLYNFDPYIFAKITKMSYFDPYFSSKFGKMYKCINLSNDHTIISNSGDTLDCIRR